MKFYRPKEYCPGHSKDKSGRSVICFPVNKSHEKTESVMNNYYYVILFLQSPLDLKLIKPTQRAAVLLGAALLFRPSCTQNNSLQNQVWTTFIIY